MKFKNNISITTYDFFYDLFQGGYLKPLDIIEDKEEAKKVEDARLIILNFYNECLNQEIVNEV